MVDPRLPPRPATLLTRRPPRPHPPVRLPTRVRLMRTLKLCLIRTTNIVP